MANLLRITLFSIHDQIRHKSFYLLVGASILLVLLLRGCYTGNVVINNQRIDNLTLAWHASKFAFHLISGGIMLLTTLLSMSVFTRDSQNGNMVLILSKPIQRSEYIRARLAGVWCIVSVFMVILHLTIVVISYLNTGDIAFQFFPASLVCTLNLLFLILLVSLLSLFLPDFIAVLTAIGIIGISFISDSFFIAKHSKMLEPMLSTGPEPSISLWRIIWPKTALLQYYAASLLGDGGFVSMGPIHPMINILFYIFLSYFLLVWVFNRKEI